MIREQLEEQQGGRFYIEPMLAAIKGFMQELEHTDPQAHKVFSIRIKQLLDDVVAHAKSKRRQR